MSSHDAFGRPLSSAGGSDDDAVPEVTEAPRSGSAGPVSTTTGTRRVASAGDARSGVDTGDGGARSGIPIWVWPMVALDVAIAIVVVAVFLL